jgi:WD40 repeat protein
MQGNVTVLDIRVDAKGATQQTRSSLNVHDRKINSIDFHKQDDNTFATSCTDGTVCLWDLRYMGAASGAKTSKQCKALATLQLSKACHGASFVRKSVVQQVQHTKDTALCSIGTSMAWSSEFAGAMPSNAV